MGILCPWEETWAPLSPCQLSWARVRSLCWARHRHEQWSLLGASPPKLLIVPSSLPAGLAVVYIVLFLLLSLAALPANSRTCNNPPILEESNFISTSYLKKRLCSNSNNPICENRIFMASITRHSDDRSRTESPTQEISSRT